MKCKCGNTLTIADRGNVCRQCVLSKRLADVQRAMQCNSPIHYRDGELCPDC